MVLLRLFRAEGERASQLRRLSSCCSRLSCCSSHLGCYSCSSWGPDRPGEGDLPAAQQLSCSGWRAGPAGAAPGAPAAVLGRNVGRGGADKAAESASSWSGTHVRACQYTTPHCEISTRPQTKACVQAGHAGALEQKEESRAGVVPGAQARHREVSAKRPSHRACAVECQQTVCGGE